MVTSAVGSLRLACRARSAAGVSPVRMPTVHPSPSPATAFASDCTVSPASARMGVIHSTRSGGAFCRALRDRLRQRAPGTRRASCPCRSPSARAPTRPRGRPPTPRAGSRTPASRWPRTRLEPIRHPRGRLAVVRASRRDRQGPAFGGRRRGDAQEARERGRDVRHLHALVHCARASPSAGRRRAIGHVRVVGVRRAVGRAGGVGATASSPASAPPARPRRARGCQPFRTARG